MFNFKVESTERGQNRFKSFYLEFERKNCLFVNFWLKILEQFFRIRKNSQIYQFKKKKHNVG